MRKKTKSVEEQISALKAQLKALEGQKRKESVKNCAICSFSGKCPRACQLGMFCPKLSKPSKDIFLHAEERIRQSLRNMSRKVVKIKLSKLLNRVLKNSFSSFKPVVNYLQGELSAAGELLKTHEANFNNLKKEAESRRQSEVQIILLRDRIAELHRHINHIKKLDKLKQSI